MVLKKGGVLNIVRRKIELKCLAESIPENIDVDLAGLDIGTSIRISSVTLPQNAELTITDRDFVVATIAAPTIVKEPEKPAEELLLKEKVVKRPLLKVQMQQHQVKRAKLPRKRIKVKTLHRIKNSLLIKKPQIKNKYLCFYL